jgi:hypothetical protein
VDAAELDILLEELETRVERLRALYEQYFLGIEKIPPHVAHKDVDRRLYTLRREQIRNTAKRFKLQTVIQRYNTFQQYWMRIMREIENGTYRRHVLRAERTIGVANLLTSAERKRLGLAERASTSRPDQAQNFPARAWKRKRGLRSQILLVTSNRSLQVPIPPRPKRRLVKFARKLSAIWDSNSTTSWTHSTRKGSATWARNSTIPCSRQCLLHDISDRRQSSRSLAVQRDQPANYIRDRMPHQRHRRLRTLAGQVV